MVGWWPRMRMMTTRYRAALACRLPPRFSRCRVVFPLDAGIGQAPHSFANAASEWIRSGLSPTRSNISAAVPTATLVEGTAVEIATGAMVPAGTTAVVRIEESARTTEGLVTGVAREQREWREAGEEATAGEELLPSGAPVNPAVIGFAASCGYDTLAVRPAPGAAGWSAGGVSRRVRGLVTRS